MDSLFEKQWIVIALFLGVNKLFIISKSEFPLMSRWPSGRLPATGAAGAALRARRGTGSALLMFAEIVKRRPSVVFVGRARVWICSCRRDSRRSRSLPAAFRTSGEGWR
jgi:hypothetical protein